MTGRPVFVAQEPPSGGGRPKMDTVVAVIAVSSGVFLSNLFDLPITLSIFLVLLVLLAAPVVAAAAAVRALLRATLVATPGAVPCPRCQGESRDSSGWCAGCSAALLATQVDRGHPVLQMLQTLDRGDVAAASRLIAPRLTSHMSNGQTVHASNRDWRRGARILLWIYGTGGEGTYTVHPDPAEPDVVWHRSQFSATARPFFPNIEGQSTKRYRVSDGRIVEEWEAPILLPSACAAG